jgi:uncharacterized repeat protein (TIGR03803 family)
MMVASNGKLYGTCAEGGTNGFGTIFEYVTGTNTLTVLRQLNAADGTTPVADMMQASDGNLYGTLSESGSFASGSIYRIAPATGVFTRVGDFDADSGTGPSGDMAEISGTLYGTTSQGGLNSNGTVFSFVIATGVITDVHDMATAEGASSEAGLLLGSDGKLYGACASGGSASLLGTVFRYDPVAATATALRTLTLSDGFYPRDGVVKETVPAAGSIQIAAKVMLDGPYNSGTLLMNDALRSLVDFPLTEPYTTLGFSQAGGGGGETTTAPVLAVSGNNAIVDWVRLELRSSSDNTSILATKQCLVQRDGDVVATDGVSPVTINIAPGNYYVAVRHRNHLSAMTAATVALSASPVTVDFTLTSTATFGTNARKLVGSVNLLWAGNTVRDTPAPWLLKYTGGSNDRDPILAAIGGVVPTNTVTGYRVEDVTLDGVTKYTGGSNDRDPILANIGGVVPTTTRADQLP